MTQTPAADIVEKRKISGCPLCGATPHHGLGKVEHCSLHGEPFQRFSIWCPSGHARVTSINESVARKEWAHRPEIEALRAREAELEKEAIGLKALADSYFAAEHEREGLQRKLDEAVKGPLDFDPRHAKAWWIAKMPNSRFVSARLSGDGYVKIAWRDDAETGDYSVPWVLMSRDLAPIHKETENG